MITDSVVHEIDVVPCLVGEPIAAIEVKYPKHSSLAPQALRDPQLVLLETESGVLADVEINVNVQFGYQMGTDVVFERGVAEIGRAGGLSIYKDGGLWRGEQQDFPTCFGVAGQVSLILVPVQSKTDGLGRHGSVEASISSITVRVATR